MSETDMKAWCDQLVHHEEGLNKQASDTFTEVTRTRIREDGFQRAILPFQKITDNDLDYFGDSEHPGKWAELEPHSEGAMSIAYNDSPGTEFYRSEKYPVLFYQISTPVFTKNRNELRTYKTDPRAMVKDNMLRDIPTEEDTRFITYIDRICDSTNEVNYGAAEIDDQSVLFNGSEIDRATYVDSTNFLEDRDMNNGIFLCNRRTAKQWIKWGRTELGGDLSEKAIFSGNNALTKFEFMDVPHVATIKRDLVENGVFYQFAAPNFLGKAWMLEDIRVTVTHKHDIIEMRADEMIGVAIGNYRAVQRIRFENERTTFA